MCVHESIHYTNISIFSLSARLPPLVGTHQFKSEFSFSTAQNRKYSHFHSIITKSFLCPSTQLWFRIVIITNRYVEYQQRLYYIRIYPLCIACHPCRIWVCVHFIRTAMLLKNWTMLLPRIRTRTRLYTECQFPLLHVLSIHSHKESHGILKGQLIRLYSLHILSLFIFAFQNVYVCELFSSLPPNGW